MIGYVLDLFYEEAQAVFVYFPPSVPSICSKYCISISFDKQEIERMIEREKMRAERYDRREL